MPRGGLGLSQNFKSGYRGYIGLQREIQGLGLKFPQIRAGGHNNKDSSLLSSILGSPISGNHRFSDFSAWPRAIIALLAT